MADNSGKEEPKSEDNNEENTEESEEGSETQGSSGSLMKRIRKIVLVIAVITLVGGGLLMYSEDILGLFQNILGSLVSGDSETAIESIVLTSDRVQGFVENATKSSMDVSQFLINEARLMFTQMREDCNISGNTDSIGGIHRVIVRDEGSNKSLVVWLDSSAMEILCVVEGGNWTVACQSHSYSRCFDNDFYWFNSCGEVEEMKLSCFGICKNNTCVPGCVLEGLESTPESNLSCCEGLEMMPNSTLNEQGQCTEPIDDSFICLECGDGTCMPPENECSCPKDCKVKCEDSDGLDYKTQGRITKGDFEIWDECINIRNLTEFYCEYNAIKNETYRCPDNHRCYFGKCVFSDIDCIEEGEISSTGPFRECCKGLEEAYLVRDEWGNCKENPFAFVCIKCGNNVCGPGETLCNCNEDCEGYLNYTA